MNINFRYVMKVYDSIYASRFTQAYKYETQERFVYQVFLQYCDGYLKVGNQCPSCK